MSQAFAKREREIKIHDTKRHRSWSLTETELCSEYVESLMKVLTSADIAVYPLTFGIGFHSLGNAGCTAGVHFELIGGCHWPSTQVAPSGPTSLKPGSHSYSSRSPCRMRLM